MLDKSGDGQTNKRSNSKLKVRQGNPLAMREKILNESSSFAVNEAYKAARTNLLFLRTEETCQIIAVTSTFEAEGKTTNCINLSISLAQAGMRTLLIDADLRRPMTDKMFDARSVEGLSDYLACLTSAKSAQDIQSLIRPTGHENLSILPAGHIPPNPVELLASKRMELMLEELSKHYDYIMIDTPPVSVVTDATVLKNHINGYLIVIRSGQTPRDALTESVMHMKQIDANILGFLLNDVDVKSSYRKYSYRYRKYGKYYKYGHYSGSRGYDNPYGYGEPDYSSWPQAKPENQRQKAEDGDIEPTRLK